GPGRVEAASGIAGIYITRSSPRRRWVLRGHRLLPCGSTWSDLDGHGDGRTDPASPGERGGGLSILGFEPSRASVASSGDRERTLGGDPSPAGELLGLE